MRLRKGDIVEWGDGLGIVCTFDEGGAPGIRWLVAPNNAWYFNHKDCDMYIFTGAAQIKVVGHAEI